MQEGDKILVTYAYNGSGVAMRTEAVIDSITGDKARVIITGENAEAIKCLGGITTTVTTSALTQPGSLAPIASFGWLD